MLAGSDNNRTRFLLDRLSYLMRGSSVIILMEITSKKIVCFGGGTGLPALLSGLKHNPWLEITAIVNVFDNGGSSGVLRDRYGILPPGDVLKCLLALSENEIAAREILLKRIEHATMPGHTGGNMLLLALQAVYGSHEEAIHALGQILSIRGAVVPVSHQSSTLCAEFVDASQVQGETVVDGAIRNGKEIQNLFLEPRVSAAPAALAAIGRTDSFVIGPGSFYTSILPNFLPEGIAQAIRESSAPIIFICNLLTEGLGMRGQTVQVIIAQLEQYLGRRLATVIVNTALPDQNIITAYANEHKYPLIYSDEFGRRDPRIVTAALWTDPTIARHDSTRLAAIIGHCVNAKK